MEEPQLPALQGRKARSDVRDEAEDDLRQIGVMRPPPVFASLQRKLDPLLPALERERPRWRPDGVEERRVEVLSCERVFR